MYDQRIRPLHAVPVDADDDAARERRALARLLIWAEREAADLGCADAAAHLRAALRSVAA
jgi:hypothetical protein